MFTLGPVTNYASVGFFQEFSTFFVAFRYLLFFYGYSGGDWRQSINSFFLAISFFFIRTIGQVLQVAMVTLVCFDSMVGSATSLLYRLLMVVFFTGVSFNIFLNVHWSWLILKQIIRIFTRGAAVAEKQFVGTEDGKSKQERHVQLAEVPETKQNDI